LLRKEGDRRDPVQSGLTLDLRKHAGRTTKLSRGKKKKKWKKGNKRKSSPSFGKRKEERQKTAGGGLGTRVNFKGTLMI